MEIEHRLDSTQVEYGYIWWKKKRENEKYRKVFPLGEFTLDLESQKLTKHVDWDRARVSIGPKVMQRHFQQDDTIIISKSHHNTVIVRKISSGERTEGERDGIFNCETCKYFKGVGSYQNMGECHRNPPAFTSLDKATGVFPHVGKNNFCGEYKPEDPNNATRVHILARELHVKSTPIIKKCQEHNFDIKNHMSLVSLGLAALIREWFTKPN